VFRQHHDKRKTSFHLNPHFLVYIVDTGFAAKIFSVRRAATAMVPVSSSADGFEVARFPLAQGWMRDLFFGEVVYTNLGSPWTFEVSVEYGPN
jgi:hypothetical protein